MAQLQSACFAEWFHSRFDAKQFKFDSEPDVNEVLIANDLERDFLMGKVREGIEVLDWYGNDNVPSNNEILLEAMHLIYGGR